MSGKSNALRPGEQRDIRLWGDDVCCLRYIEMPRLAERQSDDDEGNESVDVEIDGKKDIQLRDGNSQRTGAASMVKGKKYPIQATYFHDDGFDSYHRLKRSCSGRQEDSILAENLRHTGEQADKPVCGGQFDA